MPITTAQTYRLTEPTVVRHWHPRYGYCTLCGFPPDVNAERLYKEQHGYWPPVRLRGLDGVAVGPWREGR